LFIASSSTIGGGPKIFRASYRGMRKMGGGKFRSTKQLVLRKKNYFHLD